MHRRITDRANGAGYLANISAPKNFQALTHHEFWYFWEKDGQEIIELYHTMADFFQLSDTPWIHSLFPEITELQNTAENLMGLIRELNLLYQQAQGKHPKQPHEPIGHILTKGKNLIDTFEETLTLFHGAISAFSKNYIPRITTTVQSFQKRFPYIDMRPERSWDDPLQEEEKLCELMHTYSQAKSSNLPLFNLFDRFVARAKPRFTITPSKLKSLFSRLSIGSTAQTYFSNVRRYRRIGIRILNENDSFDYDGFFKSIYLQKDIKRQEWLKQQLKIPFEELFFTTEFFDACTYWHMILERFPGGIYHPVENQKFTPISYPALTCLANLFIDTLSTQDITDFLQTLQQLANSNITIEPMLFIQARANEIISRLNKTAIVLLVLSDIRHINGTADLKTLWMLGMPLQHKEWAIQIKTIAALWHQTVHPSLRDMYHLSLFIEIYFNAHADFFISLANEHITLSSSDLHDIHAKIQSLISPKETEQSEVTLAIVEKKRLLFEVLSNKHILGRKMMLVIAPKSDWNTAMEKTAGQVRQLPKDKFEVHFAYIVSARQMANLIKEIAAKRTIDILIINAHGTDEQVRFGRPQQHLPKFSSGHSPPDALLTGEILNSPFFDNIDSCFSKNAVGYLLSCSTAAHQSAIASAIANRFKIRIVGPRKKSQSRFYYDRSDDALTVDFGKNVPTQTFEPPP